MADKKRSQSLQEQLDRLIAQSPKPYTPAEEAEIKRGRRGQADIDAGRATIEKRNEEVRKAQEQIDKLNEQIGRAVEFERTSEKGDVKDAAKAKETAEKESLWGRAVQVGAGAPAIMAGNVIGKFAGEAANKRADAGQEFKNKVLREIADDRVKGLTTREGAIAGARRAGVLPSNNPILRTIPRGSTQMGLGAAMAAKGVYDIAHTNPEDPWLNVATRTGLAGGLIGAGVGIAEKGWERMGNPQVSPDGAALARIESNQLRRGGLNQVGPVDKGALTPASSQPAQTALPPPQSGPIPGGREHLAEQARALGVKVTTRMTKADLAKAIADKATEAAGKRARMPKLPKGGGAAALAGGLAYAMTPEDAQAYDPSTGAPTGGGNGRALGNAAIAGGTAYGASRAIGRLPPIVGRGLGAAGTGMMLYDESRAALSGQDADSHNSPEWQQAMRIMDTQDQARATPGMFGQQSDAELKAALEAFLANQGDMNAEAY